jgi:hypothetical protein
VRLILRRLFPKSLSFRHFPQVVQPPLGVFKTRVLRGFFHALDEFSTAFGTKVQAFA